MNFKITCFILSLFISYHLSAQYNFNAYIAKAERNIADSNFTEAIKNLNICIQVQPDNNEAYFYRAICKYSLYDDIGAEQDYTTALSGYSPVYYDAYHDRSLVRYRLGNYKGAIDDVNKVIEKQPNNPKLYIERAFSLLADNDFNGALNDCKKAIKLKWIGADVYLCKAAAEDALADYDNALCDYDMAIKINSTNTDFYVRRGMTKYKMENYDDAIDDYNLALKIDTACTFAYFNRADAEMKLENNKKALSDYNTVIFYEPRNAYAYFNRAILFANMKKYKNGIEDFDKVLVLNPDNIQAIFNRAKLKQNSNDYKGAIEDYNKVIALYPYFTEAYYNRAQLKNSMGDISGAKKDIETGKVMSEMLHSKNNSQLSRDSLLLANLVRLSADFSNNSSAKEDTVIAGMLPLFFIAENISGNNSAFSPLLEKLNNNKKYNFHFSNKQFTADFIPDSSKEIINIDSIENNIVKDLLPAAIRKTNMMLFNEAREYYNKIISAEPSNAIAWFARGVNTCREIEMMSNSNEPYLINGSSHAIVQNEKNEKCKSALADFTKALQLQPSFTFAYYNRANVKCLLQDFNGALKDYETSIKINPDFAQGYFNKGFLLYYIDNREQACSDFSKAGEMGVAEAYVMMKRFCFK